jgi:hypothetical protein
MLDCSLACTVLISTAYAVQTRFSLQILLACDLDYSCSLSVNAKALSVEYWFTGSVLTTGISNSTIVVLKVIMTSVLPPFVQAASGSLGAASANALTYPLDLITTRIQATEKGTSIRKQIHTYGLSSLYDGIGADTGATLLSRSVASAVCVHERFITIELAFCITTCIPSCEHSLFAEMENRRQLCYLFHRSLQSDTSQALSADPSRHLSISSRCACKPLA